MRDMPVLTEEKRQALIEYAKDMLSALDGEVPEEAPVLAIYHLALASLVAESRYDQEVKEKTRYALMWATQKKQAEALQAQLDALAKQEPAACKKRLVNHRTGVAHHWTYHGEVDEASEGDIFRVEVVPLFEHAAPAVPVRVPDGFKLVPVEPTPVMLAAIKEAGDNMRGSHATYSRLLAAAPEVE